MKLYCTTFVDDEAPDGGMLREVWTGTQAAQKKSAKELKLLGMRNIVQVSVDVPTAKAGLIAFLNQHKVRP